VSFRARRVQHIPKRESKDVKHAELQDLRKENQKLKRECARLRRELQKQTAYSLEIEEQAETESTKKYEKEQICPVCGAVNSLTQMQLSVKVLTICKKCKWRKPN
jgi:predicted RNase H-like nuclease (RuvC/YqgF family)